VFVHNVSANVNCKPQPLEKKHDEKKNQDEEGTGVSVICSNKGKQEARTSDIVSPKPVFVFTVLNANTSQTNDSDMPKSTEELNKDLSSKEKKRKSSRPSKHMTSIRIGAIRATQNLSQHISAYFVPENASRRHRPRSRKGPLAPTFSKAL
jgi:hypothetical protein